MDTAHYRQQDRGRVKSAGIHALFMERRYGSVGPDTTTTNFGIVHFVYSRFVRTLVRGA
jgi:hypothetical protein